MIPQSQTPFDFQTHSETRFLPPRLQPGFPGGARYFVEQGGCPGLLQAEDNDGHQCKEKLDDLQILDGAAPSRATAEIERDSSIHSVATASKFVTARRATIGMVDAR